MPEPLHILLADDDEDDRFFFDLVLKGLAIETRLSTVEDGESLMNYLSENSNQLPDVLFLDLNMPRKNGSECLVEIKHNEKLKDLPVIIYSTSLHEDVADLLYKNGAHYYVRKTDMVELQKVLQYVLTLMIENRAAIKAGKFERPGRKNFILSLPGL
jgi:CheY-like chemotaxis protein